MAPLTPGQEPLYACLNHQQNLSGVSVVGGPDNGMSGGDFFLSGEEVEPTSFLSSGYDPDYHTAEGMVGSDEGSGIYAPQLAPAVVDLFEADCTFVLDATHSNTGDPDNGSRCYILCDEAVYFTADVGTTVAYSDNNDTLSNVELGVAAPAPAGRYKMAVTRADGSVSISVNGGTVATMAADSLGPITTIVLGVARLGSIIHEFTIYPPQDDADLPALST